MLNRRTLFDLAANYRVATIEVWTRQGVQLINGRMQLVIQSIPSLSSKLPEHVSLLLLLRLLLLLLVRTDGCIYGALQLPISLSVVKCLLCLPVMTRRDD